MDAGNSSLLTLLTRRHELLERLDAEPMRKCDLATDLGVSRSTVDRSIRELERRGLIERDGRTYGATLAGELALAEYERFDRRLSDIVDAQDLLSALPATATLDPDFLEGAEVYVSSRPDPEQPAYHVEQLVESATHQRAYAQAFLDHLVSLYHDAILDGLECEFALTEPVLERLVARHRESIAESLATGNVHLGETTERLPFCLSVVRNERTDTATALVLIFVDEGLKGVITNDDPAAVEWAESTLTSIWTEATALSFADDVEGE